MKRTLAESKGASKRAAQRGGGAKRRRVRDKVLSTDQEADLRYELERTQNRLSQDERKAKKERVRTEARKEEVAAVKNGKKPFFQKKSSLRERELVAQYQELKKEGKLEKFLAKRRRKLDASQKRALPGRTEG